MKVLTTAAILLIAMPVAADGWDPDMHKDTAESWCSDSNFPDLKQRQACLFGFHHGGRFGYGTGRAQGFTAGFELGRGAPGPVVRLYRDSAAYQFARIHVATFDSIEHPREDHSYNGENCEIVRGLMQSQPGVVVSYWCEFD